MASVRNFLDRIQFKLWVQKALVSGLVGLCIGGIFAILFWALTAFTFAHRQYDVNNLWAEPSYAKQFVEGSGDFQNVLIVYIQGLEDLVDRLVKVYSLVFGVILLLSAIEGVILGLIFDGFSPAKGRIIGGIIGGFLAALSVGLLVFAIAINGNGF
ncbi:MAG: hypothetical protein Fur0022_12460 [Anaerolineales bacterium]